MDCHYCQAEPADRPVLTRLGHVVNLCRDCLAKYGIRSKEKSRASGWARRTAVRSTPQTLFGDRT
jgi:hypothetical protein